MRAGMTVMLLTLVLGSSVACGKSSSHAAAARSRGVYHLQQGHYDVAIHTLDSAIAMNPEDAEAYNSRGNAYASKDDLDLAIKDYDRAIDLNPKEPFAFKNRGTTYAAKDDVQRAIQDFDKSIALKPAFAGALNGRGFLFLRAGENQRALQDFDKSIQLEPGSVAAVRNRATAHFILGHFAEAAADLERSLKFYESEKKPTEPLSATGAHAVLWLHIAKMRLHQNDSAEFAARSARIDQVQWPRPIVSFYTGKLTADQLLATSSDSASEKQRTLWRCGAEFYIANAATWKNQPGEARKHFEATRADCPDRYVEHLVAEAELQRLGAAK